MNHENPPESDAPRGVGRQAKFGLALIGILIVVFVAVLVVKISGPSDSAAASDSSPQVQTADVKSASGKTSQAGHGWGKRKRHAPSAGRPTEVAQKPTRPRAATTGRTSSWGSGSSGTSPELSMMPDVSAAKSPAEQVTPLPAPPGSAQAVVSSSVPNAFGASQTQASQTGNQATQAAPYPPSGAYGTNTSAYPSNTPSYPSGSTAYPAYPAEGSSQRSNNSSAGYGSASSEPNPLRGRGHGRERHADYPPYQSGSQNGYTAQEDQSQRRGRDRWGRSRDDDDGFQRAPHSPKKARSYSPMPNYGTRSGSTDPYGSPSSYSSLGGPRDDGKYVVGPNESFSTISKRLYGTDAYFLALAECNRTKYPDPDRLSVGDVIVTPDESELVDKYPDLCPRPEHRKVIRSRITSVGTSGHYADESAYTVQHGDTLFDIARFKLGLGARWPEIYQLNQDALQGDFNYLTPGMRLTLPEESSDAVTQRPASSRTW